MIKTQGLTHLHLYVRDMQRSLQFYESVFGMEEQFRQGDKMVFLSTPGSHDLITLHLALAGEPTGELGSVAHFGFGGVGAEQMDEAVRLVEASGGCLVKRGQHAPGEVYAYVKDPDGYVIEL